MPKLIRYALLAILILVIPSTQTAQAKTKTSRSKSFRTFWNGSAPFLYAYEASVTVTYTSSYDSRQKANVVKITGVDQSVIMYSAGRFGNPCKIRLGISVDVYDKKGRKIKTLYGDRWGSYIYSPNDLLYGRVSNPNLTVLDPTFKATATASSIECFNLPSSLKWSFAI